MRFIVAILLAGACGSTELDQPSPPPEWPMGDAANVDLPDGNAKPPTAPPEPLEPAAAPADTDAPATDAPAAEEPAAADPTAPTENDPQ